MEMGQSVEDALRKYWDTDPDSEEARQLDYPAIRDFFYVARRRQAFLSLRSADPTRADELIPLVRSLQDKLPGTIIVANQSSLFSRLFARAYGRSEYRYRNLRTGADTAGGAW